MHMVQLATEPAASQPYIALLGCDHGGSTGEFRLYPLAITKVHSPLQSSLLHNMLWPLSTCSAFFEHHWHRLASPKCTCPAPRQCLLRSLGEACRVRATPVLLLPEPSPRQWLGHTLRLLENCLLQDFLQMCWGQPAYLECFREPGQAKKDISSCACYHTEQPASTLKPTLCNISFLRGEADASITRLEFKAARCSRIMLYACNQGYFKKHSQACMRQCE